MLYTEYWIKTLPDWCLYRANNEYHGEGHRFLRPLSAEKEYRLEWDRYVEHNHIHMNLKIKLDGKIDNIANVIS